MHINIKEKLAEKGLNKNQFARMVQIGYPAACAIYDGKTTRISFDVLEAICRVLECTPNDILVPDDPTTLRLYTYARMISEMTKKSDTES